MVDVDIIGQIKAWDINAEGDDAPSPYKFAMDKNATLTMDTREE